MCGCPSCSLSRPPSPAHTIRITKEERAKNYPRVSTSLQSPQNYCNTIDEKTWLWSGATQANDLSTHTQQKSRGEYALSGRHIINLPVLCVCFKYNVWPACHGTDWSRIIKTAYNGQIVREITLVIDLYFFTATQKQTWLGQGVGFSALPSLTFIYIRTTGDVCTTIKSLIPGYFLCVLPCYKLNFSDKYIECVNFFPIAPCHAALCATFFLIRIGIQ